MGELLDFLKYGAIGIAMALAGLSYKLLSREQDKDEVRKPILNTIKIYFMFAVILSVLFCGVEIYTSLNKRVDTNFTEINDLHRNYIKNSSDTTASQKKEALTCYINDLKSRNEEYVRRLSAAEEDAKYGGFYKHISTLSSLIAKFSNSINLNFEPEGKQEVFDVLNKLFIELEIRDNHLTSSEEVAKEWIKLKSSWIDSGQQYIKNSDISVLVQRYLKLQNQTTRTNPRADSRRNDGGEKTTTQI